MWERVRNLFQKVKTQTDVASCALGRHIPGQKHIKGWRTAVGPDPARFTFRDGKFVVMVKCSKCPFTWEELQKTITIGSTTYTAPDIA